MVEIHRGIDDETWDLKSIFEEHFPNLQRRSALITLFGFLEKELDKLCALFLKEYSYKIELGDLKGKGIDRSIKYLERVVGLDIDKTVSVWSEIKSIQKIRNLIVHNDGSLLDSNGETRKPESIYVDSSPYLFGNKEVVILSGYLAHILSTVDFFFKVIDESIKRKYNA